jgi:hypothetical protein
MNNALILSTFIKQLDECISDIEGVYAMDKRFVKVRLSFETVKKTNPKLIISSWKSMVTDKYGSQIEEGNINYFLTKNYSEDIHEPYTVSMDNTINELRTAIHNMSEENKAVSLKYVQNLCKLSKLYV